ncbi:MAG: N-acetylneuraminate synthase family protein [Candidatus Omnitrophica bacterium]|nr:N-acetylneuraminate synthase family protein [Candidatus Omnitrophota bacterium]MCM8788200.1 N-acetylneuraminate synthase family protein [Candidatus Omnitrophota bacterium]
MKTFIKKPLFIFEMANNHMGDVNHGLLIIRQFSEVKKDFESYFDFAIKLQYRYLDTFIHPDYKNRMDLKYIKRFLETRLTDSEFLTLVEEIKKFGFFAICTPFDEVSVDRIEKHGFDIIKIGSCSFTDWPLLERIVKTDKPVIASTAGANLDDIDKVVLFFEHREKDFSLMHCVGEYPTPDENLQLNQIDLLKQRYPELTIGFSSHENPDNYDSIKIAVAKGAMIFERHVGVKTEKYSLNAYSSTTEQIHKWLLSAKKAFELCGITGVRRSFSAKEISDLRGLKRGVYAKCEIKKGEKISLDKIFYAIPNVDGQIVANDMSKYIEMVAKRDLSANQPLMKDNVLIKDLRARIVEIMNKIKPILIAGNVALPNKLEFELSHHYGIDTFEEWGCAMINCINREYCKKLIILLPGQKNPVHYHVKKEETFNILYGDLIISLEGVEKKYNKGDMIIIERGKKHSFSSLNGAIFEEISTTHFPEDSFYDDERIEKNKDRKTYMTFWSDWLSKPIV